MIHVARRRVPPKHVLLRRQRPALASQRERPGALRAAAEPGEHKLVLCAVQPAVLPAAATATAATTAILILGVYLAPINAGLTGFSGQACNGNRGLDVACDGTCWSFVGCNSFIVRL